MKMRISDFEMIGRTEGRHVERFEFATVVVTTGYLWWKKSELRTVARQLGETWFFVDSGELTPAFQVEKLWYDWTEKERAKIRAEMASDAMKRIRT
jgi:hypothetical protein